MPSILVIDDNFDFRTFMHAALTDHGYGVELANDGREGLIAQRRAEADVLITDIFMPNQEGIETIRAFRKEFPRTPIIVVTGGGRMKQDAHLYTAKEVGASIVLKKPVAIEKILDAIGAVLGAGHEAL